MTRDTLSPLSSFLTPGSCRLCLTFVAYEALGEGLAELTDILGSCTVIKQAELPPWEDLEINRIFDSFSSKQVMVVIDKLSSFEMALAMMALQRGFEVFLVMNHPEDEASTRLKRLQQMGVLAVSVKEAVEELHLAGSSQGNTPPTENGSL